MNAKNWIKRGISYRIVLCLALAFLSACNLPSSTSTEAPAQPPRATEVEAPVAPTKAPTQRPVATKVQAPAAPTKTPTQRPLATKSAQKATLTFTPTATSESKFSLSSANATSPDDILQEVTYSPLGGGCDGCGKVGYHSSESTGEYEREIRGKDIALQLSDFVPNDNIRLFVFVYEKPISKVNREEIWVLKGWENYQVDSSGKLTITCSGCTALGKVQFVILGEKSGEVYPNINGFNYSIQKVLAPEVCHGAPLQRVKVGDKAHICTKSDSVRLREKPSKKAATITMVKPGTVMQIIGGPVCADNWSWWQVRLSNGTVGWIAEGGDDVDPYFICPAS